MIKYKATGEAKAFRLVWVLSDKKSLISGLSLKSYEGSDRWYSCFAHVLSKKQYSYFRLYLKNIQLLHPDEHTIYDQGTIEDRIKYSQKFPQVKWDILNTLKSNLIGEYAKTFPVVSKEGVRMKYSQDEINIKVRSLNYQWLFKLESEGLVDDKLLRASGRAIEKL